MLPIFALLQLLLILTSSVQVVDSLTAPHQSPRELVSNFVTVQQKQQQQQQQQQRVQEKDKPHGITFSQSPITKSVLLLPSCSISNNVIFYQRATNTRIYGLQNLQAACQQWEHCFETDRNDVKSTIGRISSTSPMTVLVQWNVTWVPPTAYWLESLARAWPGVRPAYTSYTHLSYQPSTFSYKAIFQLFADAIETGSLRIPLACIEGTTTLTFSEPQRQQKSKNSSKDGVFIIDNNHNSSCSLLLESIVEDLAYAEELQRGLLRNRKCATDLRLFLETARRCDRSILHHGNNNDRNKNNNDNKLEEDWDTVVSLALSWKNVPGMNPLDIDAQEGENNGGSSVEPLVFLAVVAISLFGFILVVAPELIGQSLLRPPTYIVSPEELNTIF